MVSRDEEQSIGQFRREFFDLFLESGHNIICLFTRRSIQMHRAVRFTPVSIDKLLFGCFAEFFHTIQNTVQILRERCRKRHGHVGFAACFINPVDNVFIWNVLVRNMIICSRNRFGHITIPVFCQLVGVGEYGYVLIQIRKKHVPAEPSMLIRIET